MKKLLLSAILLTLLIPTMPMPVHAADTLAPRVSANTIFLTTPTVASSKDKGFEGAEQWGTEFDQVEYYRKKIDATTYAYCSATQTHGVTGGVAAIADQAAGTQYKCDIMKDGKITDYKDGGYNAISASVTSTNSIGSTTHQSVAGGADVDALQQKITQTQACPVGDLICYAQQGLWTIAQAISYGFMWVAGVILGIIGTFFNWIVVITVFQFSVFFGNSQGLLLAWGILRDVGNILILFGFLYAGVAMILDLHSFDARKSIPRLIIFAVLLNFSLFAAEAVIDVANVLSAKLYQQAGQSIFADCNSLNECTNQVGIAEVIIQDTYVGSAFNTSNASVADSAAHSNAASNQNKFFAYSGTFVLMIIVAMLLLIAAIMLLVRAITLVILLITSPIGLAGMAIPGFEEMGKKWWHSLISNAFFAPIFLLLLFAGLKVMDGLRNAVSGGNQVNLVDALSNPNVGIGSIFIIFALIIGFFVAALMFAKSSGAAGATFATNFAQKTFLGGLSRVGNGGRGAASWAYGLGMRNTVGKWSKSLGRGYNERMGELTKKKGLTGWAARSFDYMAGDTVGSGFGLSKKRFGNIRSLDEAQKHQEHRKHETEHAAHEKHNRDHLNAAVAMPGGTPEQIKQRDDAIKAALKEMTQAEKEGNENLKKVGENLNKIVRNMSTKDYDSFINSDKVEGEVKEAAKATRFNPTNATYVLGGMTSESIANLPGGVLQQDHVLSALRGRDLAAIDPAKHDNATIEKIKQYIENNDTEATRHFKRTAGLVAGGGANPNVKNRWSTVFGEPSTEDPSASSGTPSSRRGSRSFS